MASASRPRHYARAARLCTFQPMLRTALLRAIVSVVGLTALSEIGVNIAPLLAGAGIVGIAIGFGSVHIVPFSAVTTITNSSRGAANRAGQILKDIVAEMRREPEYQHLIRGDLELWGVDKVDGSMASIVGQIRCTDSGRWPVQREFNRRMKRRFQESGVEIAFTGQSILMQVPVSDDVAANSMPRRAAG